MTSLQNAAVHAVVDAETELSEASSSKVTLEDLRRRKIEAVEADMR
jgi:hypothetical protein